MQINKKELLNAFNAVKPGLANKAIIEQSNSFGFSDNNIVTYNDEISIRHPIDLDLEGAVEATAFYNILNKIKPDKEGNIDIDIEDGQIIMSAGKRAKAGLIMQSELKLPLDEIQIGKWRKLPGNFKEAINVCSFTASNDMSRPLLTCLNITGGVVQASDGIRLTQYNFKKKSKMNCLIPVLSILQLRKYPIEKYSISDEWIHFNTEEGTIFSCRVLNEEYPDIEEILDIEGESLKFPRSTIDALEKAGVFSKTDIAADEVVQISIKNRKMKVKGNGSSGWYEQTMPINFDEDISFEVNPHFLRDILIDLKECIINAKDGRMKFINDNWEHVLSIEVK